MGERLEHGLWALGQVGWHAGKTDLDLVREHCDHLLKEFELLGAGGGVCGGQRGELRGGFEEMHFCGFCEGRSHRHVENEV